MVPRVSICMRAQPRGDSPDASLRVPFTCVCASHDLLPPPSPSGRWRMVAERGSENSGGHLRNICPAAPHGRLHIPGRGRKSSACHSSSGIVDLGAHPETSCPRHHSLQLRKGVKDGHNQGGGGLCPAAMPPMRFLPSFWTQHPPSQRIHLWRAHFGLASLVHHPGCAITA